MVIGLYQGPGGPNWHALSLSGDERLLPAIDVCTHNGVFFGGESGRVRTRWKSSDRNRQGQIIRAGKNMGRRKKYIQRPTIPGSSRAEPCVVYTLCACAVDSSSTVHGPSRSSGWRGHK
jgi:hypothetical protein